MEMREKNGNGLRRRLAALTAALLLCSALGSGALTRFSAIPDRLSLTAGSNVRLEPGLPVSAELEGDGARLNDKGEYLEISAGAQSGKASLILRLLGLVPLKTVDVEVSDARRLIPSGDLVGVAIESEGLIVVGMSDLGKLPSPARIAGLKNGDLITQVNGQAVTSVDRLGELIHAGEEAKFTIVRNGEERQIALTPQADSRDHATRIGAWVRSSLAGVGTLTYIDPQNGHFGVLGHAIADVDTGVTMPVQEGALYESEIIEINRGKKGAPGEIVGDFFTEPKQIGQIEQNGDFGVFGSDYSGDMAGTLYPEGLPVAGRSEIQLGAAQLLCNVDGQVRAYDCEIERVESSPSQAVRALVVRISDPELIAQTGGIVQGMSGSPIIQNGKFVGAVTHVFVNDPSMGYGICIEDMLKAAA